MTVTTNVPSAAFGDTGFIAPAESVILTGVLQDLNDAFGGNLNTALETSQGQFASSLAAIIGDMNTQFLNLVNQVDPAFASGRMQDAIARIYFLDRIPAESTTVYCDCVGAVGTVIPAGVYAMDTSKNLYICVSGGVIPSTGTLSLQWSALSTGPLACPANTLTTIYRTIPGWDTINNPLDGVIGRAVEKRAQFEARRALSTGINSVGNILAVRALVLTVPGVTDCYVTDNSNKIATTVNGVLLDPNSIYVAVVGGDPLAVATAIWNKKMPGCGYNGNTTETVYDESAGYTAPFPAYPVTFDIPTSTTVSFAVNIAAGPFVPNNAATLIQQAIVNAFSGGDNGPRATMASTIFASRFYTPIALLGSWVQIRSVKIGTGGTATMDTLTLNMNQMPTVSADSIAVTVS